MEGARAVILIAVAIGVGPPVVAQDAPSAAERYLVELRERGQLELAEARAEQQLADSTLSGRDRVGVAIQLSLVHVDRALAATTELARDAAWRRADGALDQAGHASSLGELALLVRLQRAINLGVRGQATPDGDAAVAQLRAATRALEGVSEEIAGVRRRVHASRGRVGSGSELELDELDSLANRVALQRSHLLLALGQRFEEDSADRDDALLRASQAAGALVTKRLPEEMLWSARLTHAASLRLLGKPVEAGAALARWQSEGAPAAMEGRIAAENARLLLARGRMDEAWQALEHATGDAEGDLVRIEILRRRSTAEAYPEQRESLANELSELIDSGAKNHGAAWANRAEALTDGVAGSASGDGSVESLVRAAERTYRKGDHRGAVREFDRAAAAAHRQGAVGRAFELSRTAAAILRSLGELQEASARARRMALAGLGRSDAPDAHRAAIVWRAQSLKGQSGAAAQQGREEYRDMLREHLATWPDSESIADVRWWLASDAAAGQDWTTAARHARDVPRDNPRWEAAMRVLIDARLNDARGATASPEQGGADAVRRALSDLQPLVTGAEGRWPDEWTDVQRAAALALGEVQLRRGEQDADEAQEYATVILSAALEGPPPPSAGWARAARTLLAATAARRGDLDRVAQLVEQGPDARQEFAGLLLESLERAALSGDVEEARQAATLTLHVTNAVAPDGFNRQTAWAARHAADALETLGRREERLALLDRLSAQFRDDRTLRSRHAQALVESGGRSDEGLNLLRRLEDQSDPGSAAWAEARIDRVQALVQLGRRDDAQKLLKLTHVLHPQLQNDPRLRAVEQSLSAGANEASPAASDRAR